MEKHGEIKPGVTPPENQDAANKNPVKMAEEDNLRVIRELDGDFRKCAAEATRKSLQ